ncbi:MAG: cation diffusion facilitator family transporter [bacterium]
MLLKALIAWFLLGEGERLTSSALSAIGYDQAGDVLADFTVVIAVGGDYFAVGWLDPAVAMVIGLFILKIGWEPFRENVDYLTGRSAPEEIYGVIERAVEQHGMFSNVRNIRAHHVGPIYHVSLTVECPGAMALEKVHQAEEELRDAICEENEISRVFIHVEPEG